MRHFLLAVHTDQAPRQPMSDEDMRRGYELVAALEAEMRAVDALVYSGRLDGPEEARVVRPAGRRTSATDGPYAETKEQLGGFYVIAAEDRNAALEWASRVALAIDLPIEVSLRDRPSSSVPGNDRTVWSSLVSRPESRP